MDTKRYMYVTGCREERDNDLRLIQFTTVAALSALGPRSPRVHRFIWCSLVADALGPVQAVDRSGLE